MIFELTSDQKRAVKALEKAFKKCRDAQCVIQNLYGTLVVWDGNIVSGVDFESSEYSMMDEVNDGYRVEAHGYVLDSYADDQNLHYLHLR